MIITEDWGLIDYREAWKRQKNLCDLLKLNKNHDEYLIIAEHPSVFTLGFHGNENNLLISNNDLKKIGAECIRIERGGDITCHNPGQLVIYPIIDLYKHSLGVKEYIELLEKSIIKLLKEYEISACSNSSAKGVWIDWQKDNPRKICAIGVKISRGITMHGLALNVNNDLSLFSKINPCGFTDKGVTSLSKERGHIIDMTSLKSRICKILIEALY